MCVQVIYNPKLAETPSRCFCCLSSKRIGKKGVTFAGLCFVLCSELRHEDPITVGNFFLDEFGLADVKFDSQHYIMNLK